MRWLKVPKPSLFQANLWEQDAVVAEVNDDPPTSKNEYIVAETVSLADRKEAAYQQWQTTDELQKTWAQILQELTHGLPSATFDSYLRNTVLLTIEDGEAVVGMASESGKEWLENRMSRRLKTELKQHVFTTIKSLRFVALESPVS